MVQMLFGTATSLDERTEEKRYPVNSMSKNSWLNKNNLRPYISKTRSWSDDGMHYKDV